MAEGGTSVDPVAENSEPEDTRFFDISDQYIQAAPLAVRMQIEKLNGEVVEDLTEEQILSFIRFKTGLYPLAVTIMDNKNSIIEWPKDTQVVLACQNLHHVHKWKGEQVRGTCWIAPRETLRNDLAERDEVERRRATLMRQQESHRESVLQMLEQVNSQIQNLNTLQEQMPSTSQDVVSSGSPRLINKPPNLPRFSGIDPTPKDECPFEQWFFQVSAIRSMCSEVAMKTALLSSVVGEAGEYLVFIGLDLDLDDILDKFQRRYGKRSSTDSLLRDYFQIQQQKGERVQGLAHRLERAFRCLSIEVPGVVSEETLKERLFHGMTQRLRDSMRFHFSLPDSTYESLLEASRRVEYEIVEPKTVTVKSTTVESVKGKKKGKKDPKDVQKKIDELMVQLKSANFTFSKKRERRAADKRVDKRKSGSQGAPSKEQAPDEETEEEEDLEEIKRKGKITCFRCRGRGHMAKGCSTPVLVAENINWGGSTGTQSSPEGGKGPGLQ